GRRLLDSKFSTRSARVHDRDQSDPRVRGTRNMMQGQGLSPKYAFERQTRVANPYAPGCCKGSSNRARLSHIGQLIANKTSVETISSDVSERYSLAMPVLADSRETRAISCPLAHSRVWRNARS